MDGVAKAIEDLNVIDAILGGFHGSILFTMENSAIPRRLETSPNLDGLARKVDVSTGRGANRPRRRRSVVRRTVMMTRAVTIAAHGAGNVRAGRIADDAAGDEADRPRDQRPRPGAENAVDHPAVGAGRGDHQR